MRKRLLPALFLLSFYSAFSQEANRIPKFGESKEVTGNKLREYLKYHNYPGTLTDLDSLIELHVKVSAVYTVDFTYYFDKEKKLNAYRYTNCDTCVKSYFKKLLANNQYKWKHIGENSYLSKYSKSEIIEVEPFPDNFTFTVRKLEIPRKEYKELYSNKDTTYASFIAIIDSTRATKDGIYLNGYVVDIDYDQITKLHGKEIKVSGKVTIEKAYKREEELYIRQGRAQDTKHIENPKIVVLKK